MKHTATIRHCGRNDVGARAAFTSLTNTYDAFLRHHKRRMTTELYMAGTSAPLKDAPMLWSVTARGESKEEIEWLIDNAVN